MSIAYGVLLSLMLLGGIAFVIHDFRTKKVPNKALLPYLGVALMTFAAEGVISDDSTKTLLSGILAAVIAGGIMLAIALMTKGIGGGDVKFIAVLSLILGIQGLTITMIFLAIILALYLLIAFIISKIRKMPMSQGGAFVPFIMAAAMPYMIMQIITTFL